MQAFGADRNPPRRTATPPMRPASTGPAASTPRSAGRDRTRPTTWPQRAHRKGRGLSRLKKVESLQQKHGHDDTVSVRTPEPVVDEHMRRGWHSIELQLAALQRQRHDDEIRRTHERRKILRRAEATNKLDIFVEPLPCFLNTILAHVHNDDHH